MKKAEILLDKLEQSKKAINEAISVLNGIIAEGNSCGENSSYDPDGYLMQWLYQKKEE